jgi:hypothetical protein
MKKPVPEFNMVTIPDKVPVHAYHLNDIRAWIQQTYGRDIFDWAGKTDKVEGVYYKNRPYQSIACECWQVTEDSKNCKCSDSDYWGLCDYCSKKVEVAYFIIDLNHYKKDWEREIISLIRLQFFPGSNDHSVRVFIGGRDNEPY